MTGVPFLLKNLSVQLAGTVTTNGCRLMQGTVAVADSLMSGARNLLSGLTHDIDLRS